MLTPKNIEQIEIETTNLCNLRCPLCTREMVKEQDPKYYDSKWEIPIDKLIDTLDWFPNLKYVHLVGNTSEPTLYKWFLTLLAYLNERGIPVLISTNGSTRNPDWWRNIARVIPDNSEIRFCLEHNSLEKHKMYRVGSNPEKIVNNIRAFTIEVNKIDKPITKTLQVINFEWNQDFTKEERLKLMEELGLNNLYTLPCDISSNPKFQPPKYFQQLNDIRTKLEKTNITEDLIECFVERDKFVYLNHRGQFIPCCDRYEEFLMPVPFDKYPTIYSKDHDVTQCIEHLNKLLENKHKNKNCRSACNKLAWKLEKDREVRDGKF